MKSKPTLLSRFKYTVLFLFLILNGVTQQAKGQMVYMPDSVLRATLTASGYGSCIVGDSIDSTCSLVHNCGQLYFGFGYDDYTSVSDFTGINAFVNLVVLSITTDNLLNSLPPLPNSLTNLTLQEDYNLTSLPTLPNSLTFLFCIGNALYSLPNLPNSLTDLYCGGNHLTTLPTLPTSLSLLQCGANNLHTLPTLPNSLSLFWCGQNQLTSLPTLPSNLNSLRCENNSLTSLPILPNLSDLICNNNLLTSIPTLPLNITKLDCSFNYLTALPILPNSLAELDCYNNNILILPSIPSSLSTINCSNNNLSNLPQLPASMSYLDCRGNPNLKCLPTLKTITNLLFDGTNITCLPNYGTVTNSTPLLSTVPLCDLYNNPNGCQVNWNISGKTYIDADSNCIFNGSDITISNLKVDLINNGNLVQQAFTGGQGFYSFNTDTVGIYETMLDTVGLPYDIICPAISYTDTLSTTDSLKNSRDFSFKCKSGYDLSAWSIYTHFLQPGHSASVNINAGDYSNLFGGHCATGISGQVKITFSGSVSYVGPDVFALTPDSIIGDTLIYDIPDFGVVNSSTAFGFLLYVDSTAILGSQVCISVNITPSADNNAGNNYSSQCFIVKSSYDPNEKSVSPQNNLLDYGNGWLTYTVDFQNTGTAPAEHIYILDTLDANLDVSTFQLLSFSHQPFVQILNGGIAKFNFPNINLPDSTSDEPNSHGYVQYKIKAKDSLITGNIISNSASIFFDLNNPVITNSVSDTVINCSAFSRNVYAQICNGDIYDFYGDTITTSGIYSKRFTAILGCDSVIILTLSVNSSHFTVTDNFCPNSTYNFNGSFLTQPGIYIDSLLNSNGCDSIVELTLNAIQTHYSINGTYCPSTPFNFNGQLLSMTGTYYDSLLNSNGCDSIIVLNLQLNPPSAHNYNHSICYGSSYVFGGDTITQTGIYVDSLTNYLGCDSIVTLNLTVSNLFIHNISQSICSGVPFLFSGQNLFQSGIYDDTLTNGSGCKYVNRLNLTVLPDTMVSQTNNTLTASTSSTSYHWINCTTGNIIPGATSQSFTPTVNGSYAVIVTSANCTDTSACHTVSITALNENSTSYITISPNPTKDQYIINCPQTLKGDISIKIFDTYGKLISQQQIVSGNTIIKAAGWSPGIYFMQLTNGENTSVRKLVKE